MIILFRAGVFKQCLLLFIFVFLHCFDQAQVAIEGVRSLHAPVIMTRIALQPIPDRLANQGARSGAFDIGDLVGAVVICGALLFEEPSIFYFRLMVHIGILLFATGAEVVLALGQLDQVVGLGPVFQCTVGDVVLTGVGVAFIVNFILTLFQHYYNNTTSFLPSSTHTIVRALLSPIKLAYYINLLTNQGE